MNNRRTTINHFFGYALTQQNEDFGFIRISKNASSYFASISEYEFKKWIEIKKFEGRLYASVRDPIERFFSSIPETLTRMHAPDPYRSKSDVVLSYDLWNLILTLDCNNINKFLNEWIDIVDDGFFDSHHEPQVYFLQNYKKEFYPNLNLFSLDAIDKSLDLISIQENYPKVKTKKIVNSGEKGGGTFTRFDSIKKFLSPATSSHEPSNYRKISHENPISKFSKERNLTIREARRIFYNDLVKFKNDKNIKRRIYRIYEADFELFSQLNHTSLLNVS